MKLLDCKEVCKLLKISRRTLYRRIRDAGFPYNQHQFHCKLTFNEDEISAWLAKKSLRAGRAKASGDYDRSGSFKFRLISKK